MNQRLHNYVFKTLPHVEPEANKRLREHAMDCILWAQKMADADSGNNTVTTQAWKGDGLAAEDVRKILSVSLVEENLESSSHPECRMQCETQTNQISSQSEEDSEEGSSYEGDLSKLRRAVEKALPDGIRHRQLKMLLKNAEKRQEAVRRHNETMRDYRLAGRRRMLVNLGVVSESQANRLVTDPESPLPSSLQQREHQAIEEWKERLVVWKRREDEEKARRAYSIT